MDLEFRLLATPRQSLALLNAHCLSYGHSMSCCHLLKFFLSSSNQVNVVCETDVTANSTLYADCPGDIFQSILLDVLRRRLQFVGDR